MMDGFDVVPNYIITDRLQLLLFILLSCYHNWGQTMLILTRLLYSCPKYFWKGTNFISLKNKKIRKCQPLTLSCVCCKYCCLWSKSPALQWYTKTHEFWLSHLAEIWISELWNLVSSLKSATDSACEIK